MQFISLVIQIIVICVCSLNFYLAIELTFNTQDAGNTDSRYVPPHEIFTSLTDYGIIPDKYKTLTFDVKACSQAFVLLSESRDLHAEHFYEIVLGGGGNTAVKVRKYARSTIVDYKFVDAMILSCDHFSTFTLTWSSAGRLQLRNESSEIIDWTHNAPYSINGYGIMTGWGKTGTWRFNLTECENRTYGYFCDKFCGHCMSGGSCERLNGSCLNGCMSGWQGDNCDQEEVCPCNCDNGVLNNKNFTNHTYEELLIILSPVLEEIKKELTLDKKELSSAKRKRISAHDSRSSSQDIGFVAVIILILVPGVIVLSDIFTYVKHIKRG